MPLKHTGISSTGGCCCGACVTLTGCGGRAIPLGSGAVVTVKQGDTTIASGTLDGELTRVFPGTVGSGYTRATVTVTGDGTGARVVATIAAGKVVSYTVVKGGTGYTHATATVSGDGSGATAVVSLGGHFCAPFKKGETYQVTASLPPYFADTTVEFTWDGPPGDVLEIALDPAPGYVCCARCVYPIPTILDLTDGNGFHAGNLVYSPGNPALNSVDGWFGCYSVAGGATVYTAFSCANIIWDPAQPSVLGGTASTFQLVQWGYQVAVYNGTAFSYSGPQPRTCLTSHTLLPARRYGLAVNATLAGQAVVNGTAPYSCHPTVATFTNIAPDVTTDGYDTIWTGTIFTGFVSFPPIVPGGGPVIVSAP